MKRRIFSTTVIHLALFLLVAGCGTATAPGLILYDMDQINGDLRLLGPQSDGHLARSATAGDLNGDGLDDLVVTAPGYRTVTGQAAPGAVFVVFGTGVFPPDHLIDFASANVDLTVLGRLHGDTLGLCVTVGDLNGDTIDDLIVSGDTSDVGGIEDAGAVYVVFGSGNFPANHVVDLATVNADMEILGAASVDHTGYDLDTGDVNGDSVDDLLFSVLGYDFPGRPNCGAAGVLYGSAAHTSGFVLDLSIDQPDLLVLG